MPVIYDVETFKSAFIYRDSTGVCFEISDRKNEGKEFRSYLDSLIDADEVMVGFNNVYFDYSIIHNVYDRFQSITSSDIFELAQSIINGDKFKSAIWPNDRYIKQIDLFLINHFDNMAKRTSLKNLEFVLRMNNVQELPYSPDKDLSSNEIDEVIDYCGNDIEATIRFYYRCLPAIEFREKLTREYGIDFTNHNNVKIGKDIFISILESKSPGICYGRDERGRKIIKQTLRPNGINLGEIIFPYIKFKNKAAQEFLDKFKKKTIFETKGVFKNLGLNCYNTPLVYGTGGVHGSVDDCVVCENEEYKIIDADVKSFYPNISIANNLYPEHLTELFVEEYRKLYEERSKYPKGSLENEAYKLALNGTYGNSNSKFSPFYDPAFTMSITINGQLLLTMLIDMLAPQIKIVQANTDGITAYVPVHIEHKFHSICEEWSKITNLELEFVEYKKMFIKNVNNYLAIRKDGKVKRKGLFEYNRQFHQNHSSLIIPKAVEQFLVYNVPIIQTVYSCDDCFDLMIQARCNRDSFLALDKNEKMGRNLRYYAALRGYELFKHSPPLKGKTNDRWFAIEKNQTIFPCNRADTFDVDNLNYGYYIEKAKEISTFKNEFSACSLIGNGV